MRHTFPEEAEKGRFLEGEYATQSGACVGAFLIRFRKTGEMLKCIVSDGSSWKECDMPGEPWEHVSVSCQRRCPSWEEMCFVKDLFFQDHECVVQYHPAKSNYVNVNPFVLHLWRQIEGTFPMPPVECV